MFLPRLMSCAAGALMLAMLPAGAGAAGTTAAELRREVEAVERAFARTMAERNFEAFTAFLADDAIFFSGPTPLRGKDAVAAWWKRYYEKPEAPFSWEPDEVEVLDSGDLAMTSGPARDPSGKVFGRFTSVWKREAPGRWRIVFDKGNPVCHCEQPGKPQDKNP